MATLKEKHHTLIERAPEVLKSMSLKSQLDVPGLKVYTTEDREDAIEWARS